MDGGRDLDDGVIYDKDGLDEGRKKGKKKYIAFVRA